MFQSNPLSPCFIFHSETPTPCQCPSDKHRWTLQHHVGQWKQEWLSNVQGAHQTEQPPVNGTTNVQGQPHFSSVGTDFFFFSFFYFTGSWPERWLLTEAALGLYIHVQHADNYLTSLVFSLRPQILSIYLFIQALRWYNGLQRWTVTGSDTDDNRHKSMLQVF